MYHKMSGIIEGPFICVNNIMVGDDVAKSRSTLMRGVAMRQQVPSNCSKCAATVH